MKKFDSNVGAQHSGQINPFLVSAEQVVSTKYKPRIWGEIATSEDFLYVIEVLENATEDDVVELHVCSRGGSGDAISTLIHAMQKCSAPIHVVMTGSVCSAGTIPMFYADSWECGDFTEFLFHEAILSNPPETMSASKAYTDFTYKSVERMLRSIYEGFFTEDEFVELFNGKQYWMTPEEVSDRFKMRQEFLQQSLKEAPAEAPEHECKCENCSCNEEDPVLRQIAEEMFDEAIPQKIYETIEHVRQNAGGREIQWEPQEDALMPEDIAKPKCNCLCCRDEV